MNLKCICCGKEDIRLFTIKNNYKIFKCNACGLGFVYPIPADTATVYSEDYFSGARNGFGYVDYENDKAAMKSVFQRFLALIQLYAPQKGSLLDIGTASGYFLELARHNGWEASGLEISEYAAEIAQKKGLRVKNGTLLTSNLEKNSFDAITLWDVFEHFQDPVENIKIIAESLRPEGIIAINSPDFNSLFARIMGKNWHSLIPPEHIYYFNPANTKKLLEKYGFKIILSTKIKKIFTIQYIIQFMANWLKIKYLNKIAHKIHNFKFAQLAIPLDLKDNFFIIAKKKGGN